MSPIEEYVATGRKHCELCIAFPPNAYDEAYGDGTKYICRAIGWEIHSKSESCGMFCMDERIEAKINKLKKVSND